MSSGLLSELLLKNDENFRWLSLTNNEIGIPLAELCTAIRQNHTLRKVSCHAGYLGNLSLDNLLMLTTSLAQLPHLQDLWLALPSKHAGRSSTVLKTILMANKDKEGQPCRLQKLAVRGIDDAGCRVVATALASPAAVMTDLQLRGTTAVSSTTDTAATAITSQVTRHGILAIANMLCVNRSLERVDICYKGLDGSCCKTVAKALSVNKKMTKLDLTSPSVTAPSPNSNTNSRVCYEKRQKFLLEGYKEIVNSLQQSCTLHFLNIPAQGDTKFMMDLLTKLNRSGAQACCRSSSGSLEDILEVLAEHNQSGKDQEDVSAMFELLSIHPALWDPFKAAVKADPGIAPPVRRKPSSSSHVKESAMSYSFKKQAEASTIARRLTCTDSPPKKAKAPPVMARWNENIFSKLEQEKVKNFKRWTPTILEGDHVDTSLNTTTINNEVDHGLDLSSMYTHATGTLVPAAESCLREKTDDEMAEVQKRDVETATAVAKIDLYSTAAQSLAGSAEDEAWWNFPACTSSLQPEDLDRFFDDDTKKPAASEVIAGPEIAAAKPVSTVSKDCFPKTTTGIKSVQQDPRSREVHIPQYLEGPTIVSPFDFSDDTIVEREESIFGSEERPSTAEVLWWDLFTSPLYMYGLSANRFLDDVPYSA